MRPTTPLLWIAGTPWDAIAGTEKQLATALAAHRDVIWADPPAPVLGDRAKGILPSRETVHPGVERLTVPVPPGATRPVVRLVAERILRRALLKMRSPSPGAVVVAGPMARFPRGAAGIRVFFVTDDWLAGAALMGLPAGRIRRCMEYNLREADLVVAVSPYLAAQLQQIVPGTEVMVLPNGCLTPSDGQAQTRRPGAALVGQLNERLDLEILQAVVASGTALTVIGPRTERDPAVGAGLDDLLSHNNVTWLGEMSAAAAAEQLETVTVGITPYSDTPFNRASFPLKTLDYLSAGLPVVATDLPAARWLNSGHILLEDGAEGFAAAVKRLANETPDPEQIRMRQQAAMEHSWGSRARDLLQAIEASAPAFTGDHFLITRFNLPTPGAESLVRAREGWLRERAGLFERYCLASVAAQTNPRFGWVIYFDPESPGWLREKISDWSAGGTFTPVFRASVNRAELLGDLRAVVQDSGQVPGEALITTNLDNDDGLATDFVDRLQRAAGETEPARAALYLPRGLILHGTSLYARTDRTNAFCSVVEPWEDALTCWNDWHTMLGRSMPVREVPGPPGWLQIVHGGNVSNRIRGRRTAPGPHRRSFPGLLDSALPASVLDQARELLLTLPRRAARDGLRSAVKTVLLRVAGKDGLDRVKELLRARAGMGSGER
ncbi:glycosyltransferase [Arthrobacter sp.]|uniref:glycosyltransferase n=1 Tax=Arthrobacter sp. TaxID=1667 RepID=UPI00289D9BF9|nr:glycosyltransferase [Arthrobacter sp.]